VPVYDIIVIRIRVVATTLWIKRKISLLAQ
jgi:hypothetical protein